MKKSSRLFITSLFCFFALAVGVPVAYAGCMDDAGDAVAAFLTGGASAAACELQELVDAIKGFIQLVNDLAANVTRNAKDVADAAVGAVRSAADDVANAVGNAQRTLASAASEATSLAAPQLIAAAPMPAVAGAAQAASAPGRHPIAMPGGPRAVAPAGAAHVAARPGVGPQAMAPIVLPADPQQLQAALQRGAQVLNTLQSSVEGDIARRVNDAVQRARNQATSHLAAADEIVRTALLAPINGLLHMLNDLVSNPTRLLDPVATINTMVQDITRNVVDTMNHINDVITQDAVNTLRGVEGDVQHAQSAADTGDRLLNAMRRARREKSDAALRALESQLNAASPQQAGGFGRARAMGAAMPAVAAFRFDNVHGRMRATLQRSIAPNQALANSLKTRWAAIQMKHRLVKAHPLDPRTRQTAQAELDRMFRGKSPAEVERAKQELLSKARQKYGSDPRLMASLEQNLNAHVRTHFAVAAPNAARGPQRAAPAAAGAQMR